MNRAPDPMRMLDREDTAFSELRDALLVARREGPSAEQRARLRAGLGLPLHQGDVPAPKPSPDVTPPVAVAPWTSIGIRKLVLPVTLVTVAALGGQRFLASRSRPDSAPVITAAPVAERVPADRQPRPDGEVVVIAAPVAERVPANEPRAARAQVPDAEPAASRLDDGDRLSSQSKRRHLRAPTHRSAPMRASAPATNSASRPADVAGELNLLGQARANARSAPERALALVAQHEQRYVQALFTEEREAIAVEALLNSGRIELARQRAVRFFTRFPASAHTRRLRALLLEHDSDTNRVPSPHPSK